MTETPPDLNAPLDETQAETTEPATDPTGETTTTEPVAEREYVTSKGTTITVQDGKTIAVDNDGSQREVDGDCFDQTVNVATLLNL